MGLFDKLLNQGAKTLGNMVSDALLNDQGELGETLRSVKSAVDSAAGSGVNRTSSHTSVSQKQQDNRSFEQKLNTILELAGTYEVRKGISPDELEREAGAEMYTRGRGFAGPSNFTYGIYNCGRRVLLINLWQDYGEYRRTANRQIKNYCDTHHIKMLDFFDYLPNEADYMEERIRAKLV